jgi:folate-binding protein YgfZ
VLAGADRRAYLQGLLTNDIEALAAGAGCYAAYLTPQGRMIADLRVFEIGDSLLVDLVPDVADVVRDRWSRFIFSEDVEVSDVTSQTAELGVYGPQAGKVLSAVLAGARIPGEAAGTPREGPPADLLDAMPLYANTRVDLDGVPIVVLRSDDTGVMGFDVVLPVERKAELLNLLARAGGVAVGPGAVETCRVEAGRPVFHVDMDEDTIPLEAGIEDRAISLTKGCYVGQEIIVRVLHRGHGRVARRLVGLTFPEGTPEPARGDRLRSGDRDVGSITSAVHSLLLARPIALAYLLRDFVAPGTAVTALHEGQELTATVAERPFVPAQRSSSADLAP